MFAMACGVRAQDGATPRNAGPAPAASEAAGESPDSDAGWGTPRVGVHMVSRHWPASRGRKHWNNFNPGLNVRWRNGVTAGLYKNSEFRTSVYGGWTWAREDCGLALTLGLITGYSKGTLPLAIPSMCVFEHYRLTLIPRLEPKRATVLHLSLEF